MKAKYLLLVLTLLVASACRQGATHTQIREASQPVRVSSPDADAAEPAIASASDGSVYVVWVAHGPTRAADVMLARFDGNGQMQGSPARVNPEPGMATAWRGDPPTVVVASDETVYVGWTARVESESGHATDIYLSASRDHGQTFSATKVNDDPKSAEHGMHSLSVATDGRIYVAWLDERNIVPMEMKDMKMEASTKGHHMESNREVYFASSADGGKTFTQNQRVAHDACPCCKTALAVAQDGRVYLSWRQVLPGDFRHIAIASSVDQGKTFSSPTIVSDDQWMIAGCPVSGSALAITDDKTVRVLWYSAGKNGQTGVYASESQDFGASFGPRVLVAAVETLGTPVLTRYADKTFAVWGSNQPTSTQIFSARLSGNRESGDDVLVSDGTLPAATSTSAGLFVAYIAKGNQHQEILLSSPRLD